MKKGLAFALCFMLFGGAVMGSSTTVQAASVVGGSYVKADNENNPLVTQNYGADPGVLVYNDTVYVYTTNDTQEFAGNNENTYGKINTLNCYSSKDMVNWTDHGSFKIAGSSGAAKWASNSWAPCIATKKINGQDKFFLYFANNGGGIGVLTADSPTGPWKDPIGRALITGSTPGCNGVVWMFDPAVLVDSDGTGYLYFGGGVPNGQAAHPKTVRVIKLGGDMISTSGSAATIDAPYVFEDSGINKIGNTYYYSYCSNWNCANGFNNAAIEYMTSNSPMGPFTYQGEVMKNPGVFFSGSTGNNHHQIFEFKGSYYMAYHTRSVESKVIGKSLGYRTTQIDKINVSGGKISSLTPSMSGVSQLSYVNPYDAVQAETMFTQSGIGVSGNGDGVAWVDSISNGAFTKVKGVNFNKGLASITVSANRRGAGTIQVRENNQSGTLLGTINLSDTNGKNANFTGTMKNVSGVKNICFVFNGSFEFDYWQASATGEAGDAGQGGNQGNTGNQGQVVEANLLNTYGAQYGYSGTCINLYQLRDSSQLNILKQHYNSITLENEMKPDALLGGSARLISVSEAKNKGYYIPDSYKESTVPQINFSTVDEVMKICYQNNLKMRAHTLVWHSQTPSWFFRNGYSGNGGFVNQSTMDARLEMYVKTVMNHVYLSEYGSVVYAWDIANEILHAQNSGWEAVYGNGKTNASYVKKAFNYAYDTLDYFGLTDSVKLFYNDYNTYMEVNNVITLVNYINQGKKVCAGVGMQSHLGTNYPSTDYYLQALNSFLRAGFEVQITELDITNKGDSDMANYAYNLFKGINAAKKNGGKISGITWWGLSDQTTWISNSAPLLFSRPGQPKQAYTKVIQAYTETFGQPTAGGGSNTPEIKPQPQTDPEPTQPAEENTNNNSTARIDDGWYYIKNTLSQKYLTVEGNSADGWTNVYISTGTGVDGQKWYVTNTSDGYITLTSKIGSFMLDVANGENEDGANIGIYQGYGGDAQQFIVKNTDNSGIYTIGTKASNASKYLDVYEHKTADGTNVCQWSYYGNPNQQWQFEKVGGQAQEEQQNPQQDEPQQEPSQEEPQPSGEEPAPSANGMELSYSINGWGSGYQASIKVTNSTGSAVNTWKLKLNKNQVNIASSWNVNVSEDGDYYVITPVEWNAALANGQSIEFGFLGSGQTPDAIDYTFE